MKKLSLIFAIAGLHLAAYSQTGPKIAILPTFNASGEKDDNIKTQEKGIADKYLTDEFTARKFTVIAADAVSAALADLKIDMSDEEAWKRDVLFQLGDKLGADFVIFDVITDNGQHKSPNFFTNTAEGWVSEKLWLVNVQKRSAVFSAKAFKGNSKHSEFVFGSVTGTELQKMAVKNGLADILKDFFAPYPKQPEAKPAEQQVRGN